MNLSLSLEITGRVQQGTNTAPLPDMWQQDADTGGYFIDEDTGGVITALDMSE